MTTMYEIIRKSIATKEMPTLFETVGIIIAIIVSVATMVMCTWYAIEGAAREKQMNEAREQQLRQWELARKFDAYMRKLRDQRFCDRTLND